MPEAYYSIRKHYVVYAYGYKTLAKFEIPLGVIEKAKRQ